MGAWGAGVVVSQYRGREGEREYLYNNKKNRGEERRRDRAEGRRAEREAEGDLVLVRRGMCKGGKVETGWRGESTRGGGQTHKHTHTPAQEIILDLCCRDTVAGS